ncbi:hypothetical protein HYS00_01985 [Candidatus Microgenomates bacterium]|nr:hypothetical protein [Candidatus Microgenomates bacterium]
MGYLEATGHPLVGEVIVEPGSKNGNGLSVVDQYHKGHGIGVGREELCPYTGEEVTVIRKTYIGDPVLREPVSERPKDMDDRPRVDSVLVKRMGPMGESRWTELVITRDPVQP